MTVSKIDSIAHNLARPIPRPRQKAPTPQKSWRTLRAGQWLACRVDVLLRDHRYPAGTLWTVMEPTDLGVKLVPRQGSGVLIWSDPDWQAKFNRAKKPKVKKEK